jgi:hypothetical protein
VDQTLKDAALLESVRIKRAAIEGREVYEVTMPDGKRALASSPQEVIGFCNNLMMNSPKAEVKTEVKVETKAETKVEESGAKPSREVKPEAQTDKNETLLAELAKEQNISLEKTHEIQEMIDKQPLILKQNTYKLLADNPDAVNIPFKRLEEIGFPSANLPWLMKNWKPEYKDIPFEHIKDSQQLQLYIHSLDKLNNETIVMKDAFSIVQIGKDNTRGTIRTFDVGHLKNPDGTFDISKSVDYLKKVAHASDVPPELTAVKSMLTNIKDVDALTNQPNTLNFIFSAMEKYVRPKEILGNGAFDLTPLCRLNDKNIGEFEKFIPKFNNEGLNKTPNGAGCLLVEYVTKLEQFIGFSKTSNSEFNNYPSEIKNQLLGPIAKLNNPLSVSQMPVAIGICNTVKDPHLALDICSKPLELKKVQTEYMKTLKTLQNQTNIDNKTRNSIALSLALMKHTNPSGYDALVVSKGYKEIKSGKLNCGLLKDISYDTKIDENFFYNKFEGIENAANARIAKLNNYDEKIIRDIIELDPSKADEILSAVETAPNQAVMQKTLELIKITTKNIEKNIETKDLFVKDSERSKYNGKMIESIRMAQKHPEIVEKVLKINGGSAIQLHDIVKNIIDENGNVILDVPFINTFIAMSERNPGQYHMDSFAKCAEFQKKFKDQKLLEDICNKYLKEKTNNINGLNLAFSLNSVTENNIDFLRHSLQIGANTGTTFRKMLLTKDLPEFKLQENFAKIDTYYERLTQELTIKYNVESQNIIQNYQNEYNANPAKTNSINIKYNQLLDKAKTKYLTDLSAYKSLLEMSIKDPVKYKETMEKLESSGFMGMIRNGELDRKTLYLLNHNSDLSGLVYADLAKVKAGESILPEFDKSMPLNEVFGKTQTGDAICVGEKMYINDGENLIEWQMTKEKYLELFPPVKRFTTIQGQTGNCYLVSAISNAMANPLYRADLYQLFKQDGNDIIVTIKAYEEYNGSTTFKDGAITLAQKNKHINGSKGAQMIEQAYARTAFRDEMADPLLSLTSDTKPQALAERIVSGLSSRAMHELFGLKYSEPTTKVNPNNISNQSVIIPLPPVRTPQAIQTIETHLKTYTNDPNCLLNFATIPKKGEAAESLLNIDYNLVSSHAYSIRGYDHNNRIVKISNPHNETIITQIPLDELIKYMVSLSVAKK